MTTPEEWEARRGWTIPVLGRVMRLSLDAGTYGGFLKITVEVKALFLAFRLFRMLI